MNQKRFVNIMVIIGIMMFAGVASYFIVTRQIFLPVPPPAPSPSPIPIPTSFHDVKYFYDTIQFPKNSGPLSGYKDKVSIRGRLIATKAAYDCVMSPCPESNPLQLTFSLQDVNAKNYQINIRNVNDPTVKNLQVDNIYIISGTLEHGFGHRNQIIFVFDPEKVN